MYSRFSRSFPNEYVYIVNWNSIYIYIYGIDPAKSTQKHLKTNKRYYLNVIFPNNHLETEFVEMVTVQSFIFT